MKNIKKILPTVFLAIILIFFIGYKNDPYNSPSPAEYLVSSIENFDNSSKGIFRTTWRIVKNRYLDETHNHQDWGKWKERYIDEIEDSEDLQIAVDSMLESLNDPYTKFLTKSDFEEQDRQIDSKLKGIGVHITEIDGKVIIVSVIDGTPAKKYGLKKKDQIIKVDSVVTKGHSLSEVANMVRGEKGSTVVLTILRDEKTLVKHIVREEIKIKTVKYKLLNLPKLEGFSDLGQSQMVEENSTSENRNANSQADYHKIAYIRISSFISHDTTNEFRKALFKNREADGLIVDVRGNYGGLLTNAIFISNMFLKSGNIVSIVDRDDRKRDYTADISEFVTQKPLVLLINESSASASEIFGGAIKDHRRGILVGKTSFGKGLVQMITGLPDGSGLNFTIAKYLTPLGKDIHKKGVKPDYEVDYEDNDYGEGGDVQFDKAVEVLLKKIEDNQ